MKTIRIELSETAVLALAIIAGFCTIAFAIHSVQATNQAAIVAGLVQQQNIGTSSSHWVKPATK